jgi:hypothetical protein
MAKFHGYLLKKFGEVAGNLGRFTLPVTCANTFGYGFIPATADISCRAPAPSWIVQHSALGAGRVESARFAKIDYRAAENAHAGRIWLSFPDAATNSDIMPKTRHACWALYFNMPAGSSMVLGSLFRVPSGFI